MIAVGEVVGRLGQRYPHLEQVADATFRGVDTYEGRPYAIRYFDLMMIVDNEDGLVTEFPPNVTSEAAE